MSRCFIITCLWYGSVNTNGYYYCYYKKNGSVYQELAKNNPNLLLAESAAISYSSNIALSKYSEARRKYFSSQKHKAVQLNLIKSSKGIAKAEEADKAVEETTYRIRSKAKAQEKLAESVKQYQSAKFQADALINALDVPSNNSSQEVDTSQSPSQIDNYEYDDVYTMENKTESVGKRIKREAIDIHQQYAKGTDMSAAARIVMDLGLSSILDLTHEEDVYQCGIRAKEIVRIQKIKEKQKSTVLRHLLLPANAGVRLS